MVATQSTVGLLLSLVASIVLTSSRTRFPLHGRVVTFAVEQVV